MYKELILRMSREGDETELFELWRETFGDEDKYIELFFRSFYRPGAAAVGEYDGAVVSAMYLLPAGTLYANGRALSCCYLYALSTLPDHQNRGIASLVLEKAANAAFERGYDYAYLCPADEELFAYYEKRGFVSCFEYGEEIALGAPVAAPAKLEEVGAAEYSELREEMLEGFPHMEYGRQMLEFQRLLCLSGGGGLYKFDGGIAAAEVLSGGRTVVLKELLCAPELYPAVTAAISHMFSCGIIECRAPYGLGSKRRIGLARFKASAPLSGAWAPFAFD